MRQRTRTGVGISLIYGVRRKEEASDDVGELSKFLEGGDGGGLEKGRGVKRVDAEFQLAAAGCFKRDGVQAHGFGFLRWGEGGMVFLKSSPLSWDGRGGSTQEGNYVVMTEVLHVFFCLFFLLCSQLLSLRPISQDWTGVDRERTGRTDRTSTCYVRHMFCMPTTPLQLGQP